MGNKGQRIIVTGCSGLIGSALCERLLHEGADLVGYDLEPEGMLKSRGISGEFAVMEGDIRNVESAQIALKNADVCYHLAAISGVEAARNQPLAAFNINVQGTWSVLEACRLEGVSKVITASSNHIYGYQSEKPVREYQRMNQLDTYSAPKICADYTAQAYAHNYGRPVAIVRNTNCYGPHDPHTDHIIPGTIKAIMKGEEPVIRGNGQTKKAYLYIDDVIDAYLAVATILPYKRGEAFNVSTNHTSVSNLVETIINTMKGLKGLPSEVVKPKVLGGFNDQNDEDMDSTKIRAATDWTPKHTLESGISKTVEWMMEKVAV